MMMPIDSKEMVGRGKHISKDFAFVPTLFCGNSSGQNFNFHLHSSKILIQRYFFQSFKSQIRCCTVIFDG